MRLRAPGKVLLTAVLAICITGGLTHYPAEAQTVTVARGGPFVLPNNKPQCFTAPLKIESGQVGIPLTLTLMNGLDNRPGLTWVRVYLTNSQVATMTNQGILGTVLAQSNNFAATRQITVDLNGKVNAGQYAIAVQCGGPPGAACYWAITGAQTAALNVAAVQPEPAKPGEAITITGAGFDSNAQNIVVMLDGKSARVVSATKTSITARVPENAQSGTCKLQVKSAGVLSNALSFNVRGIPQVTGADMGGVGPQGLVHIYGKNFVPDAGSNSVTFNNPNGGAMSATVQSAKPGVLTIIAPQPAGVSFYPGLNWPCSVTVVSGGMKAQGDLTINLTGTSGWPSGNNPGDNSGN